MSNAATLGVTFGSLGVLGPQAIVPIAQLAQELGYHSIWSVEATASDAFSLLGAVAATTPALALGTGIVPVQLRTPTADRDDGSYLASAEPKCGCMVGVRGVGTGHFARPWRAARHPADCHDA